ncbi:MAG: hypothetical protein PVG53_13170 [Holophagae bacterium]|jgi:hypothetical protein
MSNGNQTPATQAPARKGLHPLAWVGIGCGVILVIVVVALMIGGFFVARTVKDVAKDFENNPGLAAARLVVRATPELEEVSVDEDAGTMTVRNTKTGEVVTVNFEDIKNGRFSWTAEDGEEVTVDVSQADSGTVKIESSDGKGMEIATGAAVKDDWPDWVPVYPGTEPKGLGTMTTGSSINGSFTLSTPDDVSKVIEFYRDQLSDAGFTVNVNTYSSDEREGAMINGAKEAEKTNVVVMIDHDADATKISVTYSKRG